MFHMTLHPHAIGFAHRVRMLEEFCREIVGTFGMWNATGSQIASWWRETFPPETYLRLEESIWQDHPGSLS
jgi:hypothetical protein